MDFFVKLSLDRNRDGLHLGFETGPLTRTEFNKIYLVDHRSEDFHEIRFTEGVAVFLGDPVFHGGDREELIADLGKGDIGSVIRKTDGFYFLAVIYERTGKLIISSGIFNILPVFLSRSGDALMLSSSFTVLRNNYGAGLLTDDRQYYVEKALFNYPLFDRTPFREISLLPSNSYLEYVNSDFRISKHTFVHDYFTGAGESQRSSLVSLSDLFIENASDFIPEDRTALALTGGFDSRVIAGIAHHRGEVPEAYAYGSEGDPDILIASEISDFMGTRFIPVILDGAYAKDYFWQNALRFMSKSHGLGNLSRAHYNYIPDNHLKGVRYHLSGNFGSELLRSMKVPGVVTSEALFDIFAAGNTGELSQKLLENPALKYLNGQITGKAISSLTTEISEYLERLPEHLTVNQKFYTYMFEEVFRKYFGPEVGVQRTFLKPRTPFLSFRFIEELLKTDLAGANGHFRESNPFKRFRGQILYAHILNRIYPELAEFRLDRGYRPKDLMAPRGYLNITYGYLKRKYSGSSEDDTPDYLNLSLAQNISEFHKFKPDEAIFDAPYIKRKTEGDWVTDQMNFVNIMSAVIYSNILRDKV